MTYPLRQLDAEFYKTVKVTTDEKETEGEHKDMFVFRDQEGCKWMWSPRPYRYEHHAVQTAATADQIQFLCPACFARNRGAVGTHRVFVSFAGRDLPEDAGSRDSNGQPSRWQVVNGDTLDDLVLTPSILLGADEPVDHGCHWHGFVGSSGIPPGHAG